ncbi:MAG: hypothetical protein OXG15_09780, partial [Gammaproteobacteria bacterium]|nr:hypothetical protein [Gammaproteobacteria bacterium]
KCLRVCQGGGKGRLGNAGWFTNLNPAKRNEELILYKRYLSKEYPAYDNYNAIEVSRGNNIPVDYDGAMGVPITFLSLYNPNQFEIIRFRKGNDGKDLSIDGKCPYFRIIIKNKRLCGEHRQTEEWVKNDRELSTETLHK